MAAGVGELEALWKDLDAVLATRSGPGES